MNWLVFHVASGQSFFSGLLLIVIAAILSARDNRRAASLSTLLAIIGAIAIAISSTPIPYWLYGLLTVVFVAWCSARSTKLRRLAIAALIGVCGVCAAAELPFHIRPTLEPVGNRSLAIVGDSVSAGLGEHGEVIWPVVLEQQYQVRVQDLSHVGETAGSALKRAKEQTIDAAIVLVEIGGNDVLGSTTAQQFAHDLDALLSHLAVPDRQVVMFELPLPPFYHAYGRAQRDAARRHGVALIPKRVFLSLLAGNGATLDSIHLSQAGHQQMADLVWKLVGPAYAASPRHEPQQQKTERSAPAG
jgi:acyl-CoA thioesterase I